MMSDREPQPILGGRFARAATYAIELHARQARKSTAIPYATHLFAVCSLVLEDGGTEDEAIAALLHDGPEDQGGPIVLEHIRMEFGSEVAQIVAALSDAMPVLGEEKQAWRPRKETYLGELAKESESVLRVSLADKLHNARTILVDLAADEPGASVWSRFNAPKADQEWYYRELLKVFERQLPRSRNLPEFRRVVGDLFG